MHMRTLGSDWTVSAIGLGCMGFSHAYGAPTERDEAIQAIRAAFDMGYTMFDTAETYGTAADLHENEKLLGEALKGIRDRVQIVTKFGIRFDESSTAVNKPLIPDAHPETIRASVEGSLKRLQTDHIDLYFQHRIDPSVAPETVAGVMADLIREGKILHWGISEANEGYLRRAHAVCPVTAVQNRYSMMARWYEALFPVYSGGSRKEPGAAEHVENPGRRKTGHDGPALPRLDVVQKAVYCPDPRQPEDRADAGKRRGSRCAAVRC